MHVAFRTLLVGIGVLACGRERVELMPREVATPELEPIDVPPRAQDFSEVPTPPTKGRSDRPDPTPGDGLLQLESLINDTTDFPVVRPEEASRCQKADFLFVVDNSSSMEDKQDALAQSFPAFMNTIEGTLMIQDFRIMAVDTDGERLDADEFPLSEADCDDALGAGRRLDQDDQSCQIADGRRFMGAGQEDIAGTFSCVATTGDSGSNRERPVEAAVTAVSQPFNEAGGCNEDFLRDDAILVVIWITDEDDDRSDGDPEDWRADLLAAKYGQEDAIVPLGLLGPEDNSLESEACAEADLRVDEAPRLHELVKSFEGGYVGDICASDYSDFFRQAVTKVSWSCERFEPPIIR